MGRMADQTIPLAGWGMMMTPSTVVFRLMAVLAKHQGRSGQALLPLTAMAAMAGQTLIVDKGWMAAGLAWQRLALVAWQADLSLRPCQQ